MTTTSTTATTGRDHRRHERSEAKFGEARHQPTSATPVSQPVNYGRRDGEHCSERAEGPHCLECAVDQFSPLRHRFVRVKPPRNTTRRLRHPPLEVFTDLVVLRPFGVVAIDGHPHLMPERPVHQSLGSE